MEVTGRRGEQDSSAGGSTVLGDVRYSHSHRAIVQYAMSGTDIASDAIVLCAMSSTGVVSVTIVLRPRYAVSGTHRAYAAKSNTTKHNLCTNCTRIRVLVSDFGVYAAI
eukprot:1206112-Rhodomonas_salina.4